MATWSWWQLIVFTVTAVTGQLGWMMMAGMFPLLGGAWHLELQAVCIGVSAQGLVLIALTSPEDDEPGSS